MDAAFALILASLACGFVAARLGAMPNGAADTLNRFVIYLCLPALILRLVPKLAFNPSLAVLAVAPWGLLVVGVALVLFFGQRLRFSRDVIAALLLCVPLGNTSFLGFPMVGALVGPDAVRLAVVYDQLGSFLIVSTYGVFVATRNAGGGKLTILAVVLRIVKFPPFIALVVALIPFHRPPALEPVLAGLAEALVPVAMFAVGLTLTVRLPREPIALAFGLGIKMFLFPLIVRGVCGALGLHGAAVRVAVLESAMPPMITAGALATMAGFAPELVAALVGYGTILALLTLPFVAAHAG
jgi:predicted permease